MSNTTSKTVPPQGSTHCAGRKHLRGVRHCEHMNWHEYFDYCPTSGVLRWKTKRPRHHFKRDIDFNRWHKLYAGKEAATKHNRGYMKVGVAGKRPQVHRVIWEMANGPIPSGMEIDHINGVKDDNRLCNLRIVTHTQNMWNVKKRCNNSTGLKGARKVGDKYLASITVMGVTHRLGWYDTPEKAHAAYCKAAKEHHGEYARTT